jgi:hypothetical protein
MRRLRDVSLPVAAAFAFFVAGNTAASADCRGEVEAAFQKLEKPDRPYRSEVTVVGGYRATIEFIPPDRVRQIVDSANNWLWLHGIETIQIGNRTWRRVNRKWLEYGAAPKISPTGLPPLEMTSETAFACLEDIAFEGKTYAGYRISFLPTGVAAVLVERGADTSKRQEEVSRALKNAPPIWRTILVDRETGLPENQILSDKDQLDSPISKIHYTYPSDLTIEPPAQ